MELDVEFGSGDTTNRYLVRLAGTDDDSLFIAKEVAYYHEKQKSAAAVRLAPLRRARENHVSGQ